MLVLARYPGCEKLVNIKAWPTPSHTMTMACGTTAFIPNATSCSRCAGSPSLLLRKGMLRVMPQRLPRGKLSTPGWRGPRVENQRFVCRQNVLERTCAAGVGLPARVTDQAPPPALPQGGSNLLDCLTQSRPFRLQRRVPTSKSLRSCESRSRTVSLLRTGTMSDLRFFGSESGREAKPVVKDFAHNRCVMSIYQNGRPARLPRPQLKRQIPAQAVHAHSCCRGAYKFVNEMHERSQCCFRYAPTPCSPRRFRLDDRTHAPLGGMAVA
jgi:hypothetical protein